MTPEGARPFALGEERTIDGVSYTCVRIDRSGNRAASEARTLLFPLGMCSHCPFSHTTTGATCRVQCRDSDNLIVTTPLVPTLALEGLLT